MLNGLPFYGKWVVDAGGIVQFSDDNGNNGTGLLVYMVDTNRWAGDDIALQLECSPAGVVSPADLPFIAATLASSYFATLQATATYPDTYTEVLAVTTPQTGLQIVSQTETLGVLGSWPALGGFGWNMYENPTGGAPYSIQIIGASAANLRAGLQGGTDYSWASLAQEDYSNLQLPDASFAYADLTDTKLNGSNLSGAVFTNVVSLSGTTLDGCNFTGASFAQVDVSGMNFNGTAMDSVIVNGANFSNATFLAVSGAPVSLTNVDFRQVASIKGAQFTGANLSGSTFAGVDLTGVDFGGANLQGTSFAGCDVTVATFSTPPVFSTTQLALTVFMDATLPYSLIGLNWSYLDLTRATIVGLPANLDGLQAEWATLTGLVLKELSITGANFQSATLQNVVFAESDLSRSRFTSAHLEGDTIIPSATLTSCTLMDVDFTGANLTNVDLSNAYFYGASASLEGATILLAIFADAYLTGVNFSGVINADFQGVTFTNACLVNASFKDCNIADYLGRPTTFAGACLHGADFTGASVTGCDLFDAAVASGPGTITITMTINGVPVPLPTSYTATVGLTAGTNNTTVCPNGQRGPCTPADLVAPNPPGAWP